MKRFYMNLQRLNRFDNLIAYEGNNSEIGIAKSLAIFSVHLLKGLALYSAFAVLYSFQMTKPYLKGIGQQMKWSVRDESLHSKMGC